MPARNPDLHGNAPDKSPVALLLIDLLNDLDFPTGETLGSNALPAARRIAALRRRARKAGIPVIYVNDNFGRWRSDFRTLLQHCLQSRGAAIAKLVAPDDDDYFVLKPKHSGFHHTTLALLLAYLEVHTLIVVGVETNVCVLFTAADAYMHDLRIVVPRDCVASADVSASEHALAQMATVLKADTTRSPNIDFAALRIRPTERRATSQSARRR